MVATTAEEAKNPQRDLPRGIIASLVICTILYVAVSLVITGMVPYDQIDPKAALATAFTSVGKGGYATLISAGAVAGLTTVVMTLMIGATRVVFAMARDWLLPRSLARTNPRTGTPVRITLIIGARGRPGRLADADRQARGDGQHRHAGRVHPGRRSPCRSCASAGPTWSGPSRCRSRRCCRSLAAVVSVYLMLNLGLETWIRFVIWMVLGFIIYFAYSRHRSRLAVHGRESDRAAAAAQTTQG